MRTKITILLTSAVLMLISSCGSKPEPSPPPSRPPSPITSAGHSPEDQHKAEGALLTQRDVGEEYSAVPFTPSRQDDADDAKLSACLGQPPTKQSETARAFSSAFVTADKRQILSSVTFVTSVEKARADLEVLRSKRGADCIRTLFQGKHSGSVIVGCRCVTLLGWCGRSWGVRSGAGVA